ncbi:MAG: hypothetical protein J7L08_04255, partial [Candidatus Aenigmarchaeota archaeon]|nr:hypothetical protein [Candidatus Aenigmarchaeota archaeon]
DCAGCGSWFWWWCTSCDVEGTNVNSQYNDCGGGSSDCTGTDCDGAMQNTNYSSCRANKDLNATINSIGFGPVSECENANTTLRNIAECGNGSYYASSNATELEEIYREIGENIVKVSYSAQTINYTSLNFWNATLFTDSYIKINYISQTPIPGYGEITFNVETPEFGGSVEDPKNSSFIIPPEGRVLDAKVTSYSSQYWTDRGLIYNGTSWNYFFKLWDYGNSYQELGDPYILHIPVDELRNGENDISINTGKSQTNTTGGSPDDKVIYTIAIKGFTNYGGVFEKYEGCTREIFYDLDQDGIVDGSETIAIGNGSDIFDPQNDALDDAFSKLLDNLNFINDSGDDDGSQTNPIDALPTEFEFDSVASGGIPWTWGPSIFTLKVW